MNSQSLIPMLFLFLTLNNLNFSMQQVPCSSFKLLAASHHENWTIFANNIFVQSCILLHGMSPVGVSMQFEIREMKRWVSVKGNVKKNDNSKWIF